MFKLFKNLSVGKKIAFVSAGTLLFTLIMGLAGWYGVRTLSDTVAASQQLSSILTKMGEISRLKASYIAAPDQEHATKVKALIDDIQRDLQDTLRQEQAVEARTALSAVQSFSTSFDSLITAQQQIREREVEITTARREIRDVGDKLAKEAQAEETRLQQSLRDQQHVVNRANKLAIQAGDLIVKALRAAAAFPDYEPGQNEKAMEILQEVSQLANQLFNASISPEVDSAAATLKDQTEGAILQIKQGMWRDLATSRYMVQAIIDLANALRTEIFAFVEKAEAAEAAMEQNLLKTRSKDFLGGEFARAAMRVASALGDYRVEPTETARKEIEQRIATLKGLHGAVKAMTGNDASATLSSLEQAFAGLVASIGTLAKALAEANENEALAANTLNEVVARNAASADTVANQALITILAAFLAALVFVVATTFGLLSLISRPLDRLTRTTLRVAEGDHTVELDAQGRKDEIGQLIAAMAVFRDNLIQTRRLQDEQEKLRQQQGRRQEEMERLVTDFRGEIQEVLRMVQDSAVQLQGTAEEMTKLADESASSSGHAADSSANASSNVNAVASAAEQLAVSIDEIARQAATAQTTVAGASNTAATANERITRLADAAQTIGDVVSLISQIAEQTNLLALNATIEAARAGEAGKGFAVVAGEVKSLATQTTQATERIAAQITGIQSGTTDAVDAIGSITRSMDEVSEYTNAIASAVTEQGGATSEISRNVQEAAEGTSSVADTIAELNSSSSRTKEAAGHVLGASSALKEKAERLQSRINKFLNDVAAA